jgi:uncharacterized protein
LGNHFIKMNQGINNWKRYTLSLIAMLLTMILGSFLYFVTVTYLAEKDGNPDSYFDEELFIGVKVNPVYDFALSNLIYIAWFAGIVVFIRLIHKRKFITLITPYAKIDWKKVFWGFGLFFILVAGTSLADFLLNPKDYSFNEIEFKDFLTLFLFVLVLTPIQTTAEEVFFRGYLMQWFGRKISHPLILSIIVGFIFGSLHFFNPEMGYSAFFVGSDYVLSGILWCYVTARTNSAELTIGAHAANNMFLAWFLTMDQSTFGELPSLFVVSNINPKISLLWTIISLSVFTYLAIKKFGKNKPISTISKQNFRVD